MRSTFLLMLMFVTGSSQSQQLVAEFGKTISSFDYRDSAGKRLENLQSQSNSYLKMGYRDVINNDNSLFVSGMATFAEYGAIGSDRQLDNFFEWNVSYLGIQLGIDYRFLRIREFSFFFRAIPSVEFLVRGNQTINNQVFNLVGEDEFNSYQIFLKGGLMMSYPISRLALFTANYSIGKTALLQNGNATDNEQLKLITHQFGFGLIINLPSCNCDN